VGERPGRPKAEANRARLMLAVTGAAGVAVAVAIALALQSWWLLIPPLALNDLVAQTAEQEDEQEAGRTRAEDIKRQQESWTPDSPTRRSRPL
jgi:1,4-dihydroxy-2-naphthoate octaprenyltransferase